MPLYNPPALPATLGGGLGKNVTDPAYGADPTFVLSSVAGFQAAATAAKANVGSSTAGMVTVPKGGYKLPLADTLNFNSLILMGEGMENSKLFADTVDLGYGKRSITFQNSETAAVAEAGARDIYMRGPSLTSVKGSYPAQMGGFRMGNAAWMDKAQATGFRDGLNQFKDHEVVTGCRFGGNGFGIFHDRTLSGGDLSVRDTNCGGVTIGSVGVHPDNEVGGGDYFKTHFGFGPASFVKQNVSSEPGLYSIALTGNVTTGDNKITSVTVTLGTPAVGKRIVGPGLPVGAAKITAVDGVTGDITFARHDDVALTSTATQTGGSFYADTVQPSLVSSSTVIGSSVEAYGNAIIYSLPDGVRSDRMEWHGVHASGAMDPNTRIAGWPITAPVNNVSIERWRLVLSTDMLAVGTEGTFKVGPGQNAELGDLKTVIDAANAAGLKTFVPPATGIITNFGGTRFFYGSPGAIGEIAHATGTYAAGDLLAALDSRTQKHNGSAPTWGVALQAGASNEKIAALVQGGGVSINVHSSNAGTIAATQPLKPDPVNAGCVAAAVRGSGTSTIPSGATSVTITHSLGATPLASELTINATANPTNDPGHVWVSSITSTQFTVNCRADPGSGGLPFSWRALSREIIGRATAADADFSGVRKVNAVLEGLR